MEALSLHRNPDLREIEKQLFSLGRIERAKGLKGEVRFIGYKELIPKLSLGKRYALYKAQKLERGFLVNPIKVREVILEKISSPFSQGYVLQFKGYIHREFAETLKGLYLAFSWKEFLEKFSDPKNPHPFQYLFMKAFLGEKEEGYTIHIYPQKNPLLEIKLYDTPHSLLVPLNSPYVKKVDFLQRKIFLSPKAKELLP